MESVSEMILNLNWETLENCHQKARLCMMYEASNGLVISMDQYQPCRLTATRSFHSQNLLHPTAKQMYTNIRFSQQQSISGITYLEKLLNLDLYYKLSSK